jgi:2-iminobutanoate/2-iminopropanoate deaminase
MKVDGKWLLVIALLIALGGGAAEVSAQKAVKRAVESPGSPKPIGPYSDAIVANGFIFLAGKVGTDPKTDVLVDGGIVEQTTQVLKNLEVVLKAAGSSFDDVVKTTVFLADMNDFAKMNEIYAKYFRRPYPARSTVQVARLPRDAKIEIEAVAVVRTGSGSDRVK